MKQKHFILALVAMLSSFSVSAQTTVTTENGTLEETLPSYVVLPEGVTESSFGDNTVTDGTDYYATMKAALEGIHLTENSVLYCKPGANLGTMTHGHVCKSLTIYGNGAKLDASGEQDFELDTYKYCHNGANACDGLTSEITLKVMYLDGCGAWGQRTTANTLNIVFENCKDMNRVYINGTTGVNNITLTNCSFLGSVHKSCTLYSNANGTITVTGTEFSGIYAPVNLNHKVAGTQTVTVDGCTFTNCGTAEYDYAAPVRVLSSVEGATSALTVTGTTFTGTIANKNGQNADILLDYGVGTTTASVSTTVATVTVEKENNVGTDATVTAEETKAFTNAKPVVAKVGDVEYYTLSEAFAAVTDDAQTVVLLADVTENLTGAYLRGNITTENGQKVTITLTNSDWVYCPYTFVIGENVTLNVPALFYYAGGAQINGTVVADAYYQRYAGTKLTINEPGSMTVTSETCIIRYMDGDANAGIYINGDNNSETIGLNLSVAYFYQGMINAKDANIVAGTYWQTNETDGQGTANLVLDNSTLTVTVYDHPAKATGNSTVTLANNSVIDATNGGFEYGDNTTLSVDASSKIIGKGGETIKFPVAKIGDKEYETFEEAYDAAQAGDEIDLLADVTVTGKLGITKAITIDGNGHSIIADETAVWYTVSGKLNIKSYNTHLLSVNADDITLKNIVLDCNNNAAGINAYCAQNVTFDNVQIINATKGMAALTINGSTVIVKTAFTALGNAIALDLSNGSGVTSALGLTVEKGTVFDLGGKTVKFASVANVETLANAVNGEGHPYFAAKDNAYFYTVAQMNNRTTAYSNGLTLLADVELTSEKGVQIKGNLEFNGYSLITAVKPTTLPDGYAALTTLDGKYVVGTAPTATVDNIGSMVVKAGEYYVKNLQGSGDNSKDMPLQFVMKYTADQSAEEVAVSPYKEWYADFVLSFTGLTDGSFIADENTYLAGFYGETEHWEGIWAKVGITGMEITEGTRYPVMMGVGMPQNYEYICAGVEEFLCAMNISSEILAANPNLKVTLELSIVDNSDDNKALEALQNGTNCNVAAEKVFTAKHFDSNYIEELTIVDGELTEFTNQNDKTVGTLTYERKLYNDLLWNALFVPFEIPVSMLTDLGLEVVYFNDVHSYDNDNDGTIDRMTMESIKLTSGTLRANHPYMFRRTSDESVLTLNLVFTDAQLFSTDEDGLMSVGCSSAYTNYTISGTYATMTADDLDGRLIINEYGNWTLMDPQWTLSPFRLHLAIEQKDGSPVIIEESALRAIPIRVIGEENEDGTTTIYDVKVDYENIDCIYDLQGRRVLEPQKGGLYIVNGKKVVF